MNLADYIRPLLRDHDCVIIPDFGGLVADVAPARRQPGRHVFTPPSKLVAFNQALTRNDGLLVDALRQHLGLPANEAREALRRAVARLEQELKDTNRTELPGIGIFRRAAGRGLAFEYTGTDNLLPAAYGLPELSARPVLARGPREQPAPVLRSAQPRRLTRALPAIAAALVVVLMVSANYLGALHAGYLPDAWQLRLPQLAFATRTPTPAAPLTSEPQQATLGQPDFSLSPAPATAPAAGLTTVAPPAGFSSVEAAPAAAAATPPAPAVAAAAPAPVEATAAPANDGLSDRPVAAAASTPAVAAVKAAPAEAAPVAPTAKPEVVSATINKATGRYYVIAGAYSSLARAEQGRRVLLKSGHDSRVILPMPGSRLFRLTAADYPDLASAEREAQRLRVSTHCDYNTLKY